MNRQHLSAFLWLRWRLRVNQFKRAGTANAVILAILAGLGSPAAFLIDAFLEGALDHLVTAVVGAEAPTVNLAGRAGLAGAIAAGGAFRPDRCEEI